MRRRDGIKYLTRCSDRNGKHYSGGYECPPCECLSCGGTDDASQARTFSRYGNTSGECAEVAWRVAYVWTRESGDNLTWLDDETAKDILDRCMSLVVNENDDVAYLIRAYGNYHYR